LEDFSSCLEWDQKIHAVAAKKRIGSARLMSLEHLALGHSPRPTAVDILQVSTINLQDADRYQFFIRPLDDQCLKYFSGMESDEAKDDLTQILR